MVASTIVKVSLMKVSTLKNSCLAFYFTKGISYFFLY